MYQALYRKWRPRTFDDVVGQSHITETLKQQVLTGRLSHAYLFTGTRGTGKTSCAKILARAVNCTDPHDGNPCNSCDACQGIENGSILDVLELDAASNNGVDQVRALRDDAIYTPAAVRKRVYIVDEVHMLSTPAFNALLKILEEPPEHLMFILATTELQKVPATIRSRCQQFSFKRILPEEIAQRLSYVAQQEGIDLTDEGAALLARLADGGLRDALSLLDQCSGGGQQVNEQTILDTLGLAGNIETANLMDQVAAHDTAAALETLSRLYANGKDVGTVLGELSSLARDLLLRKTAPQGGAALLTGGYDQNTMRRLGEQFTSQRLLQMLTLLQGASADLTRSSNRRTDAELCLIRLCDETLDESPAGLSARLAKLEAAFAAGVPAAPARPAAAPVYQAPVPAAPVRPAPPRPAPAPAPTPAPAPAPQYDDAPPWLEDEPPLPDVPEDQVPVFDVPEFQPAPAPVAPAAPPAPAAPAPAPVPQAASAEPAPMVVPASDEVADRSFWPHFVSGLGSFVPPSILPYLNNPAKVAGVWQNRMLTLWVDSNFTRSMINKPAITEGLKQAAANFFGGSPNVRVVTGKPLVCSTPSTPAAPVQQAPEGDPAPAEQPAHDAMADLLAFGGQFDNIVIK